MSNSVGRTSLPHSVQAESFAEGESLELQADLLEDLGVSEDDDVEASDADGKERKGIRKKRGSRNQSKQATSVSLLKKETDHTDLIRTLTDKLSIKKTNKFQGNLKEQFRDGYQDHLQEVVQEEMATRFSDTVRLTAKAEDKKSERVGKIRTIQQIKTEQDKKQKSEFEAQKHFRSQSKNQTKRLDTQRKITLESGTKVILTESEMEESMQHYLTDFTESLITDKAKKKKEAQDFKQRLLSKGASQKSLTNMEAQAQKLVHADLKKMMKQSFVDIGFNFDPKRLSRDLLNTFEGFTQMVELSEKLGVFGEGRAHKKESREEARSELKDFVYSEMDRTLIETRLKTDNISDLVKAFDKLNNMASFAAFDSDTYMKTFQKKLDYYGLDSFTNPNPPKGDMDTNSGRQGKKKQRIDIEFEDASPLGDKLRRLYLKKLVTHTAIDGLKLNWEIFKTERSLKRNGQADQIPIVDAETQSTGKLKLVFMLRDVFEERATLPDLSGPAYNINKKRLKDVLKGLKSLGAHMPKSEVTMMRNQSNKAIFSIIKEDYIRLEMFLQNDPKNGGLKAKKKNYLKILDRLKRESGINENIKPKLMQDLDFLSDVNIVEAA